MAITDTVQRVIRSPSCLVLGGVIGNGGSNGGISGWIKSKMAAGGNVEKFKRIMRFTSVCKQTTLMIERMTGDRTLILPSRVT